MDRNWILFQRDSQIKHDRMHIFLDLHLRRHVSPQQYPHLLTLFVNIYQAAVNAQQARQVQQQLSELEDQLDKALSGSGLGVFAGRIDTSSRVEYMFYVKSPELAKSECLRLMQQYPFSRHYVQCREDEQWDFYDYLQPSQEEKMRARNRQILRKLDDEGYRTGIPHRVHHQIVYSSKEGLDAGKESLLEQNYRIEHVEADLPGTRHEYRLHVSHVIPLNEHALNEATRQLYDMITSGNGTYEGWGIIPQEKAARKWRQLFLRFRLPAAIFIFIVLCCAAGLLTVDSKNARHVQLSRMEEIDPPLAVGKMAPALELLDRNEKIVHIGGAGHPQVLQFCDPSLEPCCADLRQLEALADQARGKAEVITVCFPRSPGQSMIQATSFPVVYDKEELDAYRAYKVKRFPVTFFIDSSGRIADVVEAGKPEQHDRAMALNQLK